MSKLLHKDDKGLFCLVQSMMQHYAREFNLTLSGVYPLPRKKCEHLFGKCSKYGNIWVRVRSSTDGKWDLQPDEPYQIIDTMSHELAHLLSQAHNNHWFMMHAAITARMSEGALFSKLTDITNNIKAGKT